MKSFKKLFAVVLAIAMVLTMATTAFADETVTNATTDHTYDVYQIFAGTQAANDTEGKLAVTGWGSGINGSAFLTALKASDKFGTPNIFADAATANDVADILAKATTTAEQAKAFGMLATAHVTTPTLTGVKDGTVKLDAGYYLLVDKTNVAGTEDAKNVSILQVTKKGDFQIQKKYDVPEVEKKVKDANDTAGTTTGWQDSADYDIGDVVPFQLTGTLPSNYADYDTYSYQFNDTMSAGLTYNNDAKVYVVNNGVETEVTNQFTLTGAVAVIKCDNLKALTGVTVNKDSKIVVRYTATLNENAVIGSAGNPNTVNLEFSNNPNAGGQGEKGKTPDDTVIVFTFKVTVNKVNPQGKPLAGAQFKLYKKVSDGKGGTTEQEIATATVVDANTTSFDFKGLDDGDYVLKETVVPAGYNGVADIEFTVTATHDIESDNPALTALSGNAASGEITFTANTTEGSLTTSVVNKTGAVLPETGGIGTTLFYVFGAILAIVAGILLVAKKRMN